MVNNVGLDLNLGYKCLGIDIAEHPNPTKDQVDRAFRNVMIQCHAYQVGEEKSAECLLFVTECKKTIYKERGWQCEVKNDPRVSSVCNFL